jgi:hypothetical protein
MSELICFCFGHSDLDIRKDVKAHSGRSTIMEEIVAAKKTGGCQCAAVHPEGR